MRQTSHKTRIIFIQCKAYLFTVFSRCFVFSPSFLGVFRCFCSPSSGPTYSTPRVNDIHAFADRSQYAMCGLLCMNINEQTVSCDLAAQKQSSSTVHSHTKFISLHICVIMYTCSLHRIYMQGFKKLSRRGKSGMLLTFGGHTSC